MGWHWMGGKGFGLVGRGGVERSLTLRRYRDGRWRRRRGRGLRSMLLDFEGGSCGRRLPFMNWLEVRVL